jgi:DnaJ-domain-containing protein 1
MKYFNKQYNYYFNDPSLQTPKEVEIRVDDKFYKLKKSNSQEELKKNYFKLAKKYHPDKPSGSTKLFQKLHQIYTALKPTLI